MAAPVITAYALKYGVIENGHSCLTPLDPVFPILNLPPEAVAQKTFNERYEEYQQRKLKGFTTRNLLDIDAVSNRSLKSTNLPNVIHPILQKDRWENTVRFDFKRKDLYPIGGGFAGDWVAGNEVVGRVLEPCLRIATMILDSNCLIPWFHALLLGQRKPIDKDRIPDKFKNIPLTSFHSISALDDAAVQETKKRRDLVFGRMMQEFDYTLGFSKPGEEPELGIIRDDNDGITCLHSRTDSNSRKVRGMIFTYLEYWLLGPLLRDDLNNAEKLHTEWHFASTLVHEIMHAVMYLVQQHEIRNEHEFYFENEPVAEIGFAYENAMFAGSPNPMLEDSNLNFDPPFRPFLGLWSRMTWPDLQAAQVFDIVLKTPAIEPSQKSVPIQLTFFESIQQIDFWNVGVRKFGLDLIRTSQFSPRMSSMRLRSTQGITHKGGPEVIKKKRLGKSNFVTDDSTKLEAKVEAIRLLAQQEPSLIAAVEYGQKVLDQTSVRGNYATQADILEKEVKSIFTAIDQSSSLEILRNVLKPLDQARRAHEQMILSLKRSERIGEAIRLETRQDLVTWNRRTRIFVKLVRLTYPGSGNDMEAQYMEDEAILLEICRMSLYKPGDSETNDPESFAEFQQLHSAVAAMRGNQINKAINLCDEIRSKLECSLFAYASAAILLAGMERGTLDERFQAAKMGHKVLGLLQNKRGVRWKEYVDIFINIAKDVGTAIQQEQKEQEEQRQENLRQRNDRDPLDNDGRSRNGWARNRSRSPGRDRDRERVREREP